MTQHAAKTINEVKSQALAEWMLDTLNKAAAALMVSVGHRTELFDTLADLPPATSERIAKAAGLNERYVREWLGAMVTARIVDEVMAEESNQTVVTGLIDAILPLVPGLVEDLREGIQAVDIGCGRGRALILMAKTFPKSDFTGYDFSEEAIAAAGEEASLQGMSNVRFEARGAARIEDVARYDLVTAFDAIHDQAAPRNVLKAIYRALRPGGVFLMQDIRASSHVHKNIDHPLGTFTYTISCLHCMTVSLALDGEGLGAAWGEEKALELLAEAGFDNVDVRQLQHDILNNYYIAAKR